MNLKKYLVLLVVMCCGSTGDTLLKKGMSEFGPVDTHHLWHVVAALGNPWILIGIACLTIFFASYLTALSWADLSYVLPATALGYVLVTFFGKYFMHENVTPWRWLGVVLISCGVGWVTRGPSLTERKPRESPIHRHGEQHEIA
ncbi:MAG TPA: DMT family transporter [Candidatus Angelobacter sp.]|nr:DMT family transporter [Candidatus Angelobacter sp.]